MRNIGKDKVFTIGLWIVIIASAVSMVIYLIWTAVYKVDPKILSVINYYNFPVEVSFLNKVENFEPFEVKTYSVTSKDDFNIVTRKQDSTELSNLKITGLQLPSQLIEVVLSETKDYCYFNANVSSIYNSESDLITQVNILTKLPQDYFVFGINDANYNVYPGSIKPSENDALYKQVKGHYPIKCGVSNNSANLETIVKVFIDYDFKKQLEYFNQKKAEIESTQNVDQLNSI